MHNNTLSSPNTLGNNAFGVHLSKDEIFPKKRITNISEKLFKCISKGVKCLSKLFASVIILFVLAQFAPELREEVPSLYRLVDVLMDCIEWVYSIFWKVFDNVF